MAERSKQSDTERDLNYRECGPNKRMKPLIESEEKDVSCRSTDVLQEDEFTLKNEYARQLFFEHTNIKAVVEKHHCESITTEKEIHAERYYSMYVRTPRNRKDLIIEEIKFDTRFWEGSFRMALKIPLTSAEEYEAYKKNLAKWGFGKMLFVDMTKQNALLEYPGEMVYSPLPNTIADPPLQPRGSAQHTAHAKTAPRQDAVHRPKSSKQKKSPVMLVSVETQTENSVDINAATQAKSAMGIDAATQTESAMGTNAVAQTDPVASLPPVERFPVVIPGIEMFIKQEPKDDIAEGNEGDTEWSNNMLMPTEWPGLVIANVQSLAPGSVEHNLPIKQEPKDDDDEDDIELSNYSIRSYSSAEY
uniref:Uncharacterized protein n=1 Tax=Anopheles minimus TaxID=112268 RepID=A0A182W5F7_9DIPT